MLIHEWMLTFCIHHQERILIETKNVKGTDDRDDNLYSISAEGEKE
jgi:hypothetical protein